MRNRAKCKLCGSILESFHRNDYVTCQCGEISIEGGQDYFKCAARDWNNFLRLDDLDNEIIPKIFNEENKKEPQVLEEKTKTVEEVRSFPSKQDLLDSLDHMIENINNLPADAKITAVNYYDWISSLSLVSALFKSLD